MSPGVLSGRRLESGVYTFTLGMDDPNEWEPLDSPTDSQMSFLADLTDMDTVTFDAAAMAPVLFSVFQAWVAEILVDGIVMTRYQLRNDRSVELAALSAPTTRFYGEHEVTLRFGWGALVTGP